MSVARFPLKKTRIYFWPMFPSAPQVLRPGNDPTMAPLTYNGLTMDKMYVVRTSLPAVIHHPVLVRNQWFVSPPKLRKGLTTEQFFASLAFAALYGMLLVQICAHPLNARLSMRQLYGRYVCSSISGRSPRYEVHR
jgi:hypothetical protein